MIVKRPLSAQEASDASRSRTRPAGWQPTIHAEGAEWIISVPTLTWGVGEMLLRLLEDEDQASAANGVAAHLLGRN